MGQILFYKNKNSDSTKKFSETDMIKMFQFFVINSMFVMFGGRVFQQTFIWVPNVSP